MTEQIKPPILADQFIIGVPIENITAMYKLHDIKYRIVCKDGVPFMRTCDYRPERRNLTIDKGLVTNVSRG